MLELEWSTFFSLLSWTDKAWEKSSMGGLRLFLHIQRGSRQIWRELHWSYLPAVRAGHRLRLRRGEVLGDQAGQAGGRGGQADRLLQGEGDAGDDRTNILQVIFFTTLSIQCISNFTVRIGWKRRILPPNCDYSPSLQCFPSRLVETPVKMVKFGSQGKLPAPHEHFEILKYHFPDTWWKDPKPDHC